MKQQLTAGLSERQIAELVEHDEVHAGEIFGEAILAAGASFVLQPVDQVDHGVEAASGPAADASPGNSYRKMALTGASSADQHGVALLGEKGATRQVADQCFVDRRAGKVKAGDVLSQRQLGDGQLILDRARLLLGDLGTEEIADDARWLVSALDAGGHHLIIGCSHAVELERRHQLEN